MNKTCVKNAMRRKNTDAIPVWFHYFAEETKQKYGERLEGLLREFSDDIAMCFIEDQAWGVTEIHAEGGVGKQVHEALISDWSELWAYLDVEKDGGKRFATHFPILDTSILKPALMVKAAARDDAFVMGCWWRAYFERLHYLRNMQNAFMDLLLEPEAVETLFDHFEAYFMGTIDLLADHLGADGIFFGDDVGMQDRLMMSPATFREILRPRYQRLFAYIHKKGLYTAMHTCGNVEAIIPDLIDIGLDVLHPIQPHTMDASHIVNEYGRDISFFGGVDVQHLLPEGTVKDVDSEIRKMFETFNRFGGFMATFANSVMPETPFENIEAAMRAMRKYGNG
ncbi:MAG: uroporphyrinogen decarboxylase family protein [Clostridia bacterium]